MLKYQSWIDKNTHSLSDKLVLIVGGTGSIGKSVIEYLLYLNAKIIIAARNVDKANKVKEELLKDYPNGVIDIESLDISDLNSIDNFQYEIDCKYPKIDYFINNAGVYSLPHGFSKQGYEIHFATNALGNYYLAKKIIFNLKTNATMIFTSSISYNFNKINFNDFEGIHYRNGIKRYGLTKRIMTFNTLHLKNTLEGNQLAINLVHPGICATELFTKTKSKIYRYLAYPFMKFMFHNSSKAALSIISGLFTETRFNEWIGPRFLGIWGLPKVSKLSKKIAMNNINKVHGITEIMLSVKR